MTKTETVSYTHLDVYKRQVNGYGFKLICIAPKHTSEPFCMKVRTEKDKILFARNKWLIAHKDSDIEGAFYGLKGDTEAV